MKNALTCLACLWLGVAQAAPSHTFEISLEQDAFLLDGKPFQIRCGELHFARVPRAYWRHRLKMCKAMGLNAVCAYMFWNYHEPARGQFDFTGEKDVAAFCREAQEEGLWVILRPGPYACAEWEFGGLPWWLLDKGADKVCVRTREATYFDAAKTYLTRVAQELRDLQVTHGGPILMVQDENEYGFYGDDGEYLRGIYKTLREGGFDVPIFTCNPVPQLKRGVIDETFKVVNFPTNPENAFRKLREVLPRGPLMCGEYYPAWYDSWGQRHHTKPVKTMIDDIGYMLDHGASFSLYMAHGGTSFGWWAGQNAAFAPTTSSYDYEAPISEQGRTTAKFFALRDLIKKHLSPEELAALPEPPPPVPLQAFESDAEAEIVGARWVPLNGDRPMDEPLAMEQLGLGYGAVCYVHEFDGPDGAPGGQLKASNLRDQAAVFADCRHVGFLDRRFAARGVTVPKGTKWLVICVTHMARYHFGQAMQHAEKGLLPPVTLDGVAVKGWKAFGIPADDAYIKSLRVSPHPAGPCSFKSFTVKMAKTDDTFLLVRGWQKGHVWVNGHPLGRFWGIGPTQTMYVPGCWLKPGDNEFLVWDFAGNVPTKGLTFVDTPVLNEMHPENDFIQAVKRASKTFTPPGEPALQGEFPDSAEAQEVRLAGAPVKARRFAFVVDSEWSNQNVAAIAEFELLDAQGVSLPHDNWTFASVSSEEASGEDGAAENAIDGQISNYWHSQWSGARAKPPHHLVVDLGGEAEVAGFRYTPRQTGRNGRVKRWRFYLLDD